jgi:hypothetical protein
MQYTTGQQVNVKIAAGEEWETATVVRGGDTESPDKTVKLEVNSGQVHQGWVISQRSESTWTPAEISVP